MDFERFKNELGGLLTNIVEAFDSTDDFITSVFIRTEEQIQFYRENRDDVADWIDDTIYEHSDYDYSFSVEWNRKKKEYVLWIHHENFEMYR